MHGAHRERGTILLALAGLVSLGIVVAFAAGLGGSAARLARDHASDRALAAAHEALLAYAAGRPIDAAVGPGYLPCPDLDDDGWAEATCGSLDGRGGQAQRLGRLPWKTLGIPEPRDGYGERLWYAVSSKHKGLLNCAASAGCLDMSPGAALGTITVREASGIVVHDGRFDDPSRAEAGGAAAVVIAPGPPLVRREDLAGTSQRLQRRDTPEAQRDPANYLDKAPGASFGGEDNAAFADRNDAGGRSVNGDGFIRGPVRLADGTLSVNDRVAAVTYDDLMPRVMRRVAAEVAQCVRARSIAAEHDCTLRDADLAACGLAPAEPPGWWAAWKPHVWHANGADPMRPGTVVLVSRAVQSCDAAAASLQGRGAGVVAAYP